ncbi:hypothetical protein QKU48_gp1047 [Fadolivirus algeromassiliense]|jgi:hypothetical protein|uniref:Uncharacterized protein n=1 Tax=Fadolivirus FV1/VV64 TaxID=3070911 RepID=A0A7D3QUW4_9VIRU|nr:hypothetical protein QKU48_gp1047 [Fadolivirus algeromassiliense]QKF94505.1 hypothetical protein Fadolivirus_1_1047 [Fadolivirus FV1/VV64]
MGFFKEFFDNLGNKHTTILIGFLNGFIIGTMKLGRFNVLLGLLVGMMFAVFTGLMNGFIDIVLPQELTIKISMQSLFTLILIIILIVLVTSSVRFDSVLAPVQQGIRF